MMGTTKLDVAASRSLVVVPVLAEGVAAPAILIIGIELLILGCGPPI